MNTERSLENYDVIGNAGIVAAAAWNNHFKNPRLVRNFLNRPSIEGSDSITFIPAETTKKQITAVIIEKGQNRLTYNIGLIGVCIDHRTGVSTILLNSQQGRPERATFEKYYRLCIIFKPNEITSQ